MTELASAMPSDPELEEVAARFPIGRRVRYFPLADEPDFITTTIRSVPWRLGHGAIVIKIVGRAGGVYVDHLKVIG